jgi:hypothetical protein
VKITSLSQPCGFLSKDRRGGEGSEICKPRLRFAEPMNQAGRVEKGVHLIEQLLDIERDLDALDIADIRAGSAALAMLAASSSRARICLRLTLTVVSIVSRR